MAKFQGKLVDDVVDDEPQKGPPPAIQSQPAGFPACAGSAQAAKVQPIAAPKKSPKFPYGFMVKHPSYGSLRVRNEEAASEEEAMEVYRKKKCPFLSKAQLADTGLRMGVLSFQPAATEIGK